MVVQHILCSRMGKREIKPTLPEMKNETSDEKNESSSSEIKNKEEENESKEENSRKECETNKDENNIKNSDDKSINDNVTKDKSKSEVIESKQENTTIDVKPQIVEVEEYFVKYRNFSYLHCEWRTEEELYKGDKRIQAKLKRFKQRQQQNTNIFENVIINS